MSRLWVHYKVGKGARSDSEGSSHEESVKKKLFPRTTKNHVNAIVSNYHIISYFQGFSTRKSN